MFIQDTYPNVMKNALKPAIFVLLSLFVQYSIAQNNKQPNIILILADDLGIGDLSSYYEQYETPNLDKLGKEGIRFNNYYSASPICSPSRAGLLTGQRPAKLHFTTFLNTREDNRKKEQVDFLDPDMLTMADVLKAEGYKTAHFGKWHLGGGRDVTDAPNFNQYGFDAWAGTYESPDPDPAITATDWIWSDQDSVKRWNRTKYFVDKTLDFLQKNRDKPCFINIWTDDVHTPWIAGDDETGKFDWKPQQERSFKFVLKEYDREIGRLMEGLKEMGLDENTLVIFISDNGPLPNFRQDRSAGLRGSKLSLYEGGIRMPLLMRWPARIKAGKVDDQTIISALDLLPSLAKLAEAPLKNTKRLDGQDLSGAILGNPITRNKPLIWEYGRNDSTVFSFPKKINRSPALAIRDQEWKFMMNQDGSDPELYNLKSDPNESVNLADERKHLVKKYSKALMKWWKDLPTFKKME